LGTLNLHFNIQQYLSTCIDTIIKEPNIMVHRVARYI